MEMINGLWRDKVASLGQLRQMTAKELKEQADILLYGGRAIEAGEEREIVSAWFYTPRQLGKELVRRPLNTNTMKHYRVVLDDRRCCECGEYCTGQLCYFCYRLNARLKYFEKLEGVEWLHTTFKGGWEAGQVVGVTMPETKYWSDTDLPAVRKATKMEIQAVRSRTGT